MRDPNRKKDADGPAEEQEGVLSPESVITHVANLPLGLRAELVMKLIGEEEPDALSPVREGIRKRFVDHCRTRGLNPDDLDGEGLQRAVLDMLTSQEDSRTEEG